MYYAISQARPFRSGSGADRKSRYWGWHCIVDDVIVASGFGYSSREACRAAIETIGFAMPSQSAAPLAQAC